MRIALVLAMLSIAGCATRREVPQLLHWQQVVTDSDRDRLRDWRTAFTHALDQARAAGHSARIESEGALLDPDSAVGGPIPDGDYRCRVIKVGAKTQGMLDYIAYPAFRCRVSRQGTVKHFDKLSGSQRHHGTIYAADQLRQVFLGTMVLGDETRAYQYGRDPERDVVAWVERIGDERWRMVLPYPRYESTLDVIELTPIS